MNSDLWLLFLLIGLVWIFLVVWTIRTVHADPRGSVGLPAAVLMTMSFLYGGAFVYAVPGYSHLRQGANWYLNKLDFSVEMVFQATLVSLLALLGFAIGAGAFSRHRVRAAPAGSLPHRFRTTSVPPLPRTRLGRVAQRAMLVVGFLSFAVFTLRLTFPLSSAVLEVGRNLLLIGLLLGAYFSVRQGKSMLPWIVLAAFVPLYYVVVWGFTSYGFLFAMALIGFWLAQLRSRNAALGGLRIALGTIAIAYAMLTAFVAWFSAREEVRQVVWNGNEGSLYAIALRTLSEIELLSPWNFDALDIINIRQNLPIFIGRMMERHELYPELRQNGATLFELPLVVVPRFLWPDKPVRGGSDFMAEHTGLTFSGSTTFGTGPVFEFYVNFGVIGVFLGFVTLGWVVRWIDRKAAGHLLRGRYLDFALLYAVGIVTIDPLLRPFFVLNGAVFALITMSIFNLALKGWLGVPARRAVSTKGFTSPKPPAGISREA